MGFGIDMNKIKILIVTVFLTAFGGATYADFSDGWDAHIKDDYKTVIVYTYHSELFKLK